MLYHIQILLLALWSRNWNLISHLKDRLRTKWYKSILSLGYLYVFTLIHLQHDTCYIHVMRYFLPGNYWYLLAYTQNMILMISYFQRKLLLLLQYCNSHFLLSVDRYGKCLPSLQRKEPTLYHSQFSSTPLCPHSFSVALPKKVRIKNSF